MKKINIFLALSFTLNFCINAQNLILNPGFENHSLSDGCYTNQSASNVSAFLNDITAFYGGTSDGIDIGVNNGCYSGGSNSGTTHIVMAGLSGPNMFESISFDLSSTLVSGQNYTLTFYAANSNPTSSESLSVGISMVSNSFGVQVATVPLGLNSSYTQYSTSFTAPSNGSYLTIEPEVLGEFWFGLDDFVLELACSPSNGTDTRTECNSYTWIDGNTYTANNNMATFNITGGAANGCDSIVTLDLTIINSRTGTDTRTECNSYTWIDGNTYTSSNNSATFNILGGAANGCDSLVTLDLTIYSVSDITTTLNGLTIIATNSNATYQWLDCNNGNTPINGETNQSFTATVNSNYAVELNENGCVDTSACVGITSVGIIENSFESMLSVYPNPTTGNFSVDLGDYFNSIKVTLTDVNGRLIQTTDYSYSQILNLNINEPKGFYILTLESENQRAIIRLVKK